MVWLNVLAATAELRGVFGGGEERLSQIEVGLNIGRPYKALDDSGLFKAQWGGDPTGFE